MKRWPGLPIAFSLLSVAWVGLFVVGDSHAYSDGVAQARALGYIGLLLLSAVLCVSPFRRWLRASSKLQRALGLAAASTALIHVEVAVWSSPLSFAEQLDEPRMRFGFGAFAVLGLLALTSFPAVVAGVRLRSWKELHRLAYLAWICALLHALLSPYAWLRGLSAIAGVVIAMVVLRLVKASSTKMGSRQAEGA
jgi:sulfoxide reductase heme-binding subunit YedZ